MFQLKMAIDGCCSETIDTHDNQYATITMKAFDRDRDKFIMSLLTELPSLVYLFGSDYIY